MLHIIETTGPQVGRAVRRSMMQAIIDPDLHVSIEAGVPIPRIEDDEILIRAVYAGVNPIDWKGARHADAIALHGDLQAPIHKAAGKDFSGYVEAVGSTAYRFHVGDRVMSINHSSGFAEYSVGKVYSTAIIPASVSLEEAVVYGLPYLAAAVLMFKDKPIAAPWNPIHGSTHQPVVIYGASSAVGAYAVKLASLANMHPIIAISGSSTDAIASILDHTKGDVLLDYRQDRDELIASIKSVATDIHFAADAIGLPGTTGLLSQVLMPTASYLSTSLPIDEGVRAKAPKGVTWIYASTPDLFEANDAHGPQGEKSLNVGPQAFATTAMEYLSFALQRGLITPHPYKVQPHGVASLEDSLAVLKAGSNGGVKHVLEIAASPSFSSL